MAYDSFGILPVVNGGTGSSTAGGTFASYTKLNQQATTSGTSVTFTGLVSPKLILINFMDVSFNGTIAWGIRIGPTGGVETTGYTGNVCWLTAATQNSQQDTSQFNGNSIGASSVWGGVVQLSIASDDNLTWLCAGTLGDAVVGATQFLTGKKAVANPLTQVQVRCSSGAFDAGAISVSYFS